jgi:hypothetical protein
VERHVTVLALLSGVWGTLGILLGLSMLLLSAGAATLLSIPSGAAVGLAAGVTAGVFAVIGLFALLLGCVHVWSALLLRRHEPLGRMLGLGLAVTNLLLLPFGTALGIYALWVLLANEGRRLFDPAIS